MSSRLVNVRLDEEHFRKAQDLRADGDSISQVLREAIDERHARRSKRKTPLDVEAIRRRLFQMYPDPTDLPARKYDIHDSKAARAEIVRQLQAKQNRAAADVRRAKRKPGKSRR